MTTIQQLIADNPNATDAEIAALFNAQEPTAKPSTPATYVTYLSIGEDVARFGAGAINVAGALRTGLAVWIAGPDLSQANTLPYPNPGALHTIADRLAGGKGVDVSSPVAPSLLALFVAGVPGAGLSPLLTQQQADALLSIGYQVPKAAESDVAAGRLNLARDAFLVRVEELASHWRLAAMNATTGADLPELPATSD